MGYTPSLHLVQAKIDEINNAGFDVHTFNTVLYDGCVWMLHIEATDNDCENHVWNFDLDLHGWNLCETPADLLAVRH